MKPSPQLNQNGHCDELSLADELRQEGDRLCKLPAKLKAREEELAEMEANYPYFKRFVYDALKARALETMEEIPNNDLQAYAEASGAVSSEEIMQILDDLAEEPFIHETGE